MSAQSQRKKYTVLNKRPSKFSNGKNFEPKDSKIRSHVNRYGMTTSMTLSNQTNRVNTKLSSQ
jgi:hypothetical protein